MALRITLPFGKEDNIKNLVFSILTKEHPLKIIDLTNFIHKRYGKSVTFQAVRKALLQLIEEGVLLKEQNQFNINKEWVINSKKQLDTLYEELTREKVNPRRIDSIQGEVSVFTFDSLNELMKFWQELIDDWFVNFKEGDSNINCYQAAHAWEGLLHLDREKELMGQLKKKGIISYIINAGNTLLDRNIRKFYQDIGIKVAISASTSSFDKSYYVGSYGDLIVQAQYPEEIVKDIELSDLVNRKIKIKPTVIKNLAMAKQINQSIISQIE